VADDMPKKNEFIQDIFITFFHTATNTKFEISLMKKTTPPNPSITQAVLNLCQGVAIDYFLQETQFCLPRNASTATW